MFSLFKKPIKENINLTEFEPILSNLINILHKNSDIGQAEFVEEIKYSLLKNEIENFKKKLISIDMWGGSGAVWEVGFTNENKELERIFILEIIKLLDLIKKSGIKSKGAQSRKKILKKFL